MSSKIDGFGSRPPSVTHGHRNSGVERSGEADSPSSGTKGGDAVTLTEGALRLQKLAQAVADAPASDTNRIANVKESVARGEYRVNTERVAARILQTERELVGR